MNETYFTSASAPPEPYLPVGWRLMAFDTLDSTNSALKRLVEQGAELFEGVLMWANAQTAGRGRVGRRWESPPGNVYASFLLEAPAHKSDAPQIGFLAARAVADTILELPRHNTAPPSVTCKWPNDVLMGGEKVCGILPELVGGPDGKDWIVLGIGINMTAVDVPNPTYPATSLAAHHIDTTAAHVLTVLSRFLAAGLVVWRAQGFTPIRDAWLARGPAVGSPVSVNPGTMSSGVDAISGTFAGLDTDGALLIDTSGGRARILAGDILFEGA